MKYLDRYQKMSLRKLIMWVCVSLAEVHFYYYIICCFVSGKIWIYINQWPLTYIDEQLY